MQSAVSCTSTDWGDVQVHTVPEAKMLWGGVYVVILRGTAMLSDQTTGWMKTAGEWQPNPSVPGMDLMLEVPRAVSEDPRGTFFEAAIFWTNAGPGGGEALWSGKYWVRSAREGPVLEEAE